MCSINRIFSLLYNQKVLFLLCHQVSKPYIMNNKPKNMIAPAILPFAGSLVGARAINNGKVLNMQAHRGSDVFPVTTATKNDTANTSNAK